MLLMLLALEGGWGGRQGDDAQAPSPPPIPPEPPSETEVFPYSTPLPEPGLAARVLLESAPGEHFECTVMALVDAYGQLLDAWATDCPDELRSSSVAAVRSWEFHPPTVDNKAVNGELPVRFAFVSNTVDTSRKSQDGVYLVRVSPTATPRWPNEPRAGLEGRALMKELGVDSLSCTLDLQVDPKGLPVEVRPVACPEELARPALRRLGRYGLDVDGAEPGDGTVYRMELWFD